MGGFALSEARGVLPSVGRLPAAGQTTSSTADSHWERTCECKECGKVWDGSAFVQNNFPHPRENLFKYRICGLRLLCRLFSHSSCKGFPRREGLRAVRWEGLPSPFLFLALRASPLRENTLSIKISEPFVTTLP